MAEISATLQHTVDTVVSGEVRTHTVTIDRPVDKGGSDKGPMGGELLLLALGGCFLSTLLGVLNAAGTPLEPGLVQLRLTGVLTPPPTRVSRITVVVIAPGRLAEALTKPLLKAERGCIVHNSIKDSIDVVFDHQWSPAA